MPTLSHRYLHKVCHSIFRAMGASEKEAEIVSTHVVTANLVGHDSHGVIQVPVYAERIKVGHIVPVPPLKSSMKPRPPPASTAIGALATWSPNTPWKWPFARLEPMVWPPLPSFTRVT